MQYDAVYNVFLQINAGNDDYDSVDKIDSNLLVICCCRYQWCYRRNYDTDDVVS